MPYLLLSWRIRASGRVSTPACGRIKVITRNGKHFQPPSSPVDLLPFPMNTYLASLKLFLPPWMLYGAENPSLLNHSPIWRDQYPTSDEPILAYQAGI